MNDIPADDVHAGNVPAGGIPAGGAPAGGVSIVPLQARHIPAAAVLERLCFSDPWTPAAFAEELANPAAHFLAAEHDGALAGYAGMTWVLDEGYVDNIAVAAASRRRGVGRALLHALDAFAREKGLAFLSLEVRVSNAPAIALYASEGFVSQGVRPGFYSRPTEDASIMTKFYGGARG